MVIDRMVIDRRPSKNQSGFTLIETMIAIIILSFGLLALASGFTQGMIYMSSSHQHRIAKEKASEAIESVNTARDTRVLAWAQIRNVSNSGIFLDGPRPVNAPGLDGLVNTSDDGSLESATLPGPGGTMDTGQNLVAPLTGFTREIEIRDVAPNLRQIRVIVRYETGHLTREYTLTSYISSFA
jgi:prepilin-type N-terminal cleavage/methylation domain-containing protein